MSIEVCLISRMNFDYTRNGGKKWQKESLRANLKHQYRLSQCGEHDWSAITKRTEIIRLSKFVLFHDEL